MLGLFLALASAAYPSTNTGVSVTSLGGSSARSCYEAAEAKDFSEASMLECNAALTGPLTAHDRVATHVNRGVLRLLQGDFAAADADFSQASKLDPNQPEAWLNKGISLYQQGKPDQALTLLERSIALRTKHEALAYFARGLANEDTGDLRAAYADLRRAQSLAPKWQPVTAELARYQVRTR